MHDYSDVADFAERAGICTYEEALDSFYNDGIFEALNVPAIWIEKNTGLKYDWSDRTNFIFNSFVDYYGECWIQIQ